MNVEDARIPAVRVEAGRLDHPSLDARSVARVVPELLDLPQFDALQHVAIDIRVPVEAREPGERVRHDIAGLIGRPPHARRHASRRQRAEGEHMGTFGDLADGTVDRGEVHVAAAAVLGREVDAAAVAGPVDLPWVTVQLAGDLSHVRSVQLDHVQLLRPIGLPCPRESRERDPSTVGRQTWARPGPPLPGDLANGTGLGIDGVDVRFPVALLPVVLQQPLEDDGAPVRGPAQAGAGRHATEQPSHRSMPVGELFGRAARSGHDEQVGRSDLEEATPVAAEVNAIHFARRLRPFGAFRRGRHVDLPLVLVGHKHDERDSGAVRRPANCRWRFMGPGDLRSRPLGIHPADEDLGVAIFRFREEGDARSVG